MDIVDISTQKCPSIPYLCLLMDALVSLTAAALYYLRFFYLLTKTYVLAISVPEAIPSICLKSYPKIKLHPNFWIGLGIFLFKFTANLDENGSSYSRALENILTLRTV